MAHPAQPRSDRLGDQRFRPGAPAPPFRPEVDRLTRIPLRLLPRRTFWILTIVALGLTGASLLGQLVLLVQRGRLDGSGTLFSVNHESSIPTWFQSFLFFLCFVLLCAISAARRRQRTGQTLGWIGLSLTFLFLSIEEVAGIHEGLSGPLGRTFGASGFLRFTWVLAGAAFTVLFAATYWTFLRRLEPRIGRLFLTAGAVYVMGAVGMEMIGGAWASAHGLQDPVYALVLVNVEELLEMLGVVIFAYALLSYVGSQALVVTLGFSEGGRLSTGSTGGRQRSIQRQPRLPPHEAGQTTNEPA